MDASVTIERTPHPNHTTHTHPVEIEELHRIPTGDTLIDVYSPAISQLEMRSPAMRRPRSMQRCVLTLQILIPRSLFLTPPITHKHTPRVAAQYGFDEQPFSDQK
ncbi:hypothetical protein QIS74_10208 [Colletotrichum tabaci]|uniref:Uncharacterized protein n=1 Tax=Colletotrichum tabaci TaxID=1209068 RepID=A0AAV9SZR3_9PEZI